MVVLSRTILVIFFIDIIKTIIYGYLILFTSIQSFLPSPISSFIIISRDSRLNIRNSMHNRIPLFIQLITQDEFDLDFKMFLLQLYCSGEKSFFITILLKLIPFETWMVYHKVSSSSSFSNSSSFLILSNWLISNCFPAFNCSFSLEICSSFCNLKKNCYYKSL